MQNFLNVPEVPRPIADLATPTAVGGFRREHSSPQSSAIAALCSAHDLVELARHSYEDPRGSLQIQRRIHDALGLLGKIIDDLQRDAGGPLTPKAQLAVDRHNAAQFQSFRTLQSTLRAAGWRLDDATCPKCRTRLDMAGTDWTGKRCAACGADLL